MALTKIGKEGITGISNASDATFLTATSSEGVTLAGTLAVTGVVTASNDMKFNSGYGSAVTAYGCRAWVNFNGTGTVAIRESANVGSITDNGTANYTVNFSANMPDVNYCWAIDGDSPSTVPVGAESIVAATDEVTFLVSRTSDAALIDQDICVVSIIR